MNISPNAIKFAFSHFLERFHMLIFTIVVLGGLAVCMFLINAIIANTGGGGATAGSDTVQASTFDQKTIDRIKQLHAADDPNKPSLDTSKGRVNLFAD